LRCFKFLKDERGNAVIEVAIMFPIVLALVFGFMMFTQAMRVNTVLQVAAREAARQYAVSNDPARAVQKAREELSLGNVDPKRATILTNADGAERKVTVKFPYGFKVPFAGEYPLTLQGSAVFRVEQSAFF
jgi:Flp pilus assembly protein TadG